MSAANTNFTNSQHRRIYQGAKGAYFVKRADGKKVYGVRASFRKVGANGMETKLNKANRNTVPSPLRRAVRKNAGVKRGPLKNGAVRKAPAARARKVVRSPNLNMGRLQRAMNTASNRAAVARAKRALKPRARSRSNEPAPRVRKPRAVRKNAGVKRGPLKNGTVRKAPVRTRKSPVRKSPLMLTMFSNANMRAAARAAKPRAVRKPRARVVRSPNLNMGRLQRAMNTASNRAALARAKRALKPAAVRKPRAVRAAANTSAMFGSPGGTVYKSKRSMVAKKRAISRIKAMNELLKAISPNPFNALMPQKRVRKSRASARK